MKDEMPTNPCPVDFAAIEQRMVAAYGADIVTPAGRVIHFSTPQAKGPEYFARMYSGKLKANTAQAYSDHLRRGTEVHQRTEQLLKDLPVRTLQQQMLDAAEQLLATKAEQSMVYFDGFDNRVQHVSMTRDEARALVNDYDRRPFTSGELMAVKLAAAGFGSHYLRQRLGWIHQQRDIRVRSQA